MRTTLVKTIGYVQAGGASSRFGGDKALAQIAGKTMLQRMCDLLTGVTEAVRIVAPQQKYSVLGIPLVADRWPGEGPLGGIVTALLDARLVTPTVDWALIVSCDMPFLNEDWLRFLLSRAGQSSADFLLPASDGGPEPLCACWRVSAASALERAFLGGTRKVTQALQSVKTEVLDERDWKRFDNAGRLFWNMNTPADYAEVCRIWIEEHLP